MKLLQLGVAVLLLAAPAGAFAQPGDDVDRYDTSVDGEPVASVEVFYDQLSPYGMWVDDPDFGQVFIPERTQFVPYTQGHWQYTSVGFVWVSAEPFEWATAHYGRWAYSRSYHRWIWRPDTVWGPSWVEWRQAGDDFGWAPLAPEIAVQIGYSPPIESWHYCSAAHVLDANVVRYYEPPRRVIEIHREARPIEHYAQIGGARVVVGPSTATLHEHHVVVHPAKIELHATGRLAPTEAHAAVTRAEAHHAANEAQNRKRIESNPAIHQVAVRAAATAPHHGEGAPAAAPPQVQPGHAPAQPEHKPAQPEHGQPQVEHKAPPQPEHKPAQPEHRPAQPEHAQPQVQPEHRPAQPEHAQPQVDHKLQQQPEHRPAQPEHAQPQVDHKPPPQPEHKPAPPQVQPEHRPPPPQAQPEHRPEPPQQAQPERKPPQAPPPQAEHRQPEHNQPPPAAEHRPEPKQEPKEPDRKRDPK